MRKVLLSLCFVAALAFVGCSDKYDDSDIVAGLENAEGRLDALEDWQMSVEEELASMQTIIEALEANDYVTNVTEITTGGEVVGYQITFAQYGVVTITNGNDGADGNDGEDGKDGTTGTNGTNGEDGDSMFDIVDVDSENGYIYIKLVGDDTEYYIPMTTEMFIFDTATNSKVDDTYYYSLDGQNLEFQIKDLPEKCVGVNAALLTANGTFESTATTRADETYWAVLTTYDSETKIATVNVTVGSEAFTDEEKALLKITAISSTGTESVAILTLAPITDAESMSEWDAILEAIRVATTASAYNYTGEIEDGYTVELPATEAGEVTINITQGLDGNGINFVDEDDDDPFEGVLYLVLPSTNVSGIIAVNLTSAATVYIIDGELTSVINGGTYTTTPTYSMAMPTRADDLDEVDAVDGADNAKIYIKSKVETVEMYSGDITIADGGSITNLYLEGDTIITVDDEGSVSSVEVSDSGSATISGEVENVTTYGGDVIISDSGSVTTSITIDGSVETAVSIEIAGTVTEVANASSSTVTLTTTGSATVTTVSGNDVELDSGIAIGETCYLTLAKAIEYADGTTAITLAADTYSSDTVVTIDKSLTIEGAGAEESIIAYGFEIDNSDAVVTFKDVAIEVSGSDKAIEVTNATTINITSSSISGEQHLIYANCSGATYNIEGSVLTGTNKNTGLTNYANIYASSSATGNTFNIEDTTLNTVTESSGYQYAINICETTGATEVNLTGATKFYYESNNNSSQSRYYFIEHRVNNDERSTFTRDASITYSSDMTSKGISLASGLLFGKGTETSPYEIYDNYDLKVLKYYTEYDAYDADDCIFAYFKQMADIEYSLISTTYTSVYPSPFTTFTPSSTTTSVTSTQMLVQNFYGVYDGNGYKINNWGYNSTATGSNWGTDQNIGLFANVAEGSIIKNLTLTNTDGIGIYTTKDCQIINVGNVGSFAGTFAGEIFNCKSEIPITIYSSEPLCYVAGILAKPMCNGDDEVSYITNCEYNGTILLEGEGSAAGIFGSNTNPFSPGVIEIINCKVSGKITAPYAYGIYVEPAIVDLSWAGISGDYYGCYIDKDENNVSTAVLTSTAE
ncbi:MAG: hypothetical protein R3Y39_08035 [Rikenellaceae bacterium]